MAISGWATDHGDRGCRGSERKLSPSHWANNDHTFGRVNPPEDTVEVPLLPQQRALGVNLVQFFGRTTTASFSVATLLRA
uniref:Uncharacterized protein n=1 Tax=Oryza barthii TaxID=65489 RepID=A0A0D3HH12_9ORYZ